MFEARCANESDQRSKYPGVNCNDYSVALVRVEQLVPFPADKILEVVARYPNAEIVWCQEEPKNMGAWTFMYFHLRSLLKKERGSSWEPRYIGRPTSASPATGSTEKHEAEHLQILKEAFEK